MGCARSVTGGRRKREGKVVGGRLLLGRNHDFQLRNQSGNTRLEGLGFSELNYS